MAHLNCTHCGRPVVLEPSAAERAAKDVTGRPASHYRSLFTMHSQCALDLRAREVSELMKRGHVGHIT